MKRLFTLILLFIALGAKAQQTVYTNGIPPLTVSPTGGSLNPTYRWIFGDSVAMKLYLGTAPTNFFQIYTASQVNGKFGIYNPVNFKGNWTSANKFDLNSSIHVTDTVFSKKGMQIGDMTVFLVGGYEVYSRVSGRGGITTFGHSGADGGGAYM